MSGENDKQERKSTSNGFSELYSFEVQHPDELVARARSAIVDVDASEVLKAAIQYIEKIGLGYPEPVNRSAYRRLVEYCEDHQDLGGSTSSPAGPERDFYFSRIYLNWKMVETMNDKVCRDTEKHGYFGFDDHQGLMRANFQLGALCREFQLATNNQRDALIQKKTRRRSKDGTDAANVDRRAKAKIWVMKAKRAAVEFREKRPDLSDTDIARHIAKQFEKDGVQTSSGSIPSIRSIRDKISSKRM